MKDYYLRELADNFEVVEIFKKIDSTNLYALRTLEKSNRRLIIAQNQTNGQGRWGKKFYSYDNCGLYFTLVLYNNNLFQQTMMKMAIAIVTTINNYYNKKLMIKWVNDIYENDKKVGGILIQQKDNYLIIGVGLNLYQPAIGYDDEINNKAQALFDDKIADKRLLVAIIKSFFQEMSSEKLLSLYKRHSLVLNKQIYHLQLNKKYYVKDFNKEGNLIVIDDNNKQTIISSGTIEMRV